MKTLKLEFYEKKTQKRSDGSPVTLEFRGNWENNGLMPTAKLTFTGCDEETASNILTVLELATPGEFLFLNKGVNPQRKLDDWFKKQVKRKVPSLAAFEAEIAEFTEDEKNERYHSLKDELEFAVNNGREDSKKFDFLFECLNHLRKELWDWVEHDGAKQEFIEDIRKPQVKEYEEEQPKEPQTDFESEENPVVSEPKEPTDDVDWEE